MLKIISYRESSKQLTIREKVGQLFMPAAFINETEEEMQKLEGLIREHQVGSLCFFHSRASAATNFEGAKTVFHNENSFETLKSLIQRYQKAAKYPLLIAIDAEWGLAMRIENTPQYPYAITLGAIADGRRDLIYDVGKNIAKDCRAAGIHWNLAPCVDINNNPDNPVIGYRSFGADRHKVSDKALAFIKGTRSEGILTSIKHFPGHGDTATDSHLALPLIDKSKQELLENELYPFQKLIDEGVDSVMVGHLSVPALNNGKTTSSSISKEIIKGALRDEMGYRGVVISDALNMHAVAKNHPIKGELEWLAFDAGNDVLCFAEHIVEGIESILKNASEDQIEESFERVWRLKETAYAASKINNLSQVANTAADRAESGSSLGSSSSSNTNTDTNTDSHSGRNSNSNTNTDPHSSRNSNSNPKSKCNSNLQSPIKLNRKLATESLTLLKGTAEIISDFRATNFVVIYNSEKTDSPFFKYIDFHKKFKQISLTDSAADEEANILLALFPPQVKPSSTFGFSKEELLLIDQLIHTKNVILYLFGNPYVLNLIDFEKTKAVVIAYQDFEVFQETAAEHFLGKLESKGDLPVNIRA